MKEQALYRVKEISDTAVYVYYVTAPKISTVGSIIEAVKKGTVVSVQLVKDGMIVFPNV